MNACTYLHDKALSYRPSGAYSLKCLEGVFSEVRRMRISISLP